MSASIHNPHFLLRRVHSLLGFLPVGGFLLFHLWENSLSRRGAAYYNEHVVEMISNMNYVVFLEIFAIALPILFHALYGLVIWWYGKSNATSYPWARNWLWMLQRLSGIGILVFLGIHVGGTRILAIFDTAVKEDMYTHMQEIFGNPVLLTVYILGLLLSIFHLCNGLWTMAITWGVLTTEAAQRRAQWLILPAFLLISAIGIHGVAGFFTGAGL